MAAIVLPSDEDSIAIFVDGTGYHVYTDVDTKRGRYTRVVHLESRTLQARQFRV